MVTCLGDEETFSNKFHYLTGKHNVGAMSDVLKRECPFCRVLSVVLRSNQLGQEDYLLHRPLSGKELERHVVCMFSPHGYVEVFTKDKDTEVMYAAPGWLVRFARAPARTQQDQCLPDSSESAYQEYLSKALPDKVEFDTIRKWLVECIDTHGPDHGTSVETICTVPELFPGLSQLRLIDVVNQNVVEVSESCPYVAVSYVWGGVDQVMLIEDSKSWLMQPGALAEPTLLPATIRDAMAVVHEAGIQYLWVDSLCLIQDDTNDLDTGLTIMDLIYEHAVFSIIAADGEDANSGLSALREHPSGQRNLNLEILPDIYMQPDLTLDALLSQSAYRTRAWTYVND